MKLSQFFNCIYLAGDGSVDAQARYESVFSLWGAIMGGGNLIVHAAGWLEGGFVASYEKFALNADLQQMIEEFLRPVVVDDDGMGLESMLEAGPGGYFLTPNLLRSGMQPPFTNP